MALILEIRSPDKTSRNLTATFLPYGSFFVYLRLRPVPSLPLKIKIAEIPNAIAGPAEFPVGGGLILMLDQLTAINDPNAPLRSYKIDSLRSFDMQWPYIKFQVFMNTDAAALNAFRGSTIQVTASDNGVYSESAQCSVLNAVPNNHYHWRKEPQFVDGAYFKCVHIDATKKKATPFFSCTG